MTKLPEAAVDAGLRSFERSLPMALLRARETVMGRFRPILAAHGLTEQQWRVLRALDDQDATVSVGELADATFLLGPSLSRMLASLDERGLVKRSAGTSDARRADIGITSKGRALVAKVAPASEAAYRQIEAQVSIDDLAELFALLSKVAQID